MDYIIRAATSLDTDAMIALLPRLADFEVPECRNPDHLWQGDRDMLLRWIAGNQPDTRVMVAVDEDQQILGISITSLREELLSHEPSAHLEVLALDKAAEGRGIGKNLITEAESAALELGARSMSLHVFANNNRARGLYEHMGFEGELIRYFKPLGLPRDTAPREQSAAKD